MTVEEFAAELSDFGENLSNMQTILTEIAGTIVDDLKADAPVDDGDLRDSIRAKVNETDLEIEMLAYGVFQNYGVDGISQSVADNVPRFGIDPQPAAGSRFGFSGDYTMIGGDLPFGARKKIYQLGIKPQRFFNIEQISELITEFVAEQIIETNQ